MNRVAEAAKRKLIERRRYVVRDKRENGTLIWCSDPISWNEAAALVALRPLPSGVIRSQMDVESDMVIGAWRCEHDLEEPCC